MKSVLLNTLYQGGILILGIYLTGLIIHIVNSLFVRLVRSNKIIIGTGLIGTPLHELSHAIMCIIFGHRIDEMKLFQFPDEDGTLGYVNHSYNRRNIYHLIGNFFIGVAPILVGSVFIFLLMYFLLPNTFSEVLNVSTIYVSSKDNLLEGKFINELTASWEIIKTIFIDIKTGWPWFVFIFISLSIAQHMRLSPADLVGSLSGIPFILLLLFLLNLVFYFIGGFTNLRFLSVIFQVESIIVILLIVAIIFSLTTLIIGILIKLITSGIWKLFSLFRR